MNHAARNQQELYEIHRGFETLMVSAICENSKLYDLLGAWIDHELLPTPKARLALRACKSIASETGKGPNSQLVVLQRIRRWISSGTVTQQEIEQVNEMFEDADDAGIPPIDEIITEMAPILRRRGERGALERGLSAWQKRESLIPVAEDISRVSKIGLHTANVGDCLDKNVHTVIKASHNVPKLATGIVDLDTLLGGGAKQGTLSMWMGGSGDGKSMALVQVACAAALQGKSVAFATLELPTGEQLIRIIANLTGFTIDAINDDPSCKAVQTALDDLSTSYNFGNILVKEFEPYVTTVGHLRDWVKDAEHEIGTRFEVVVVDYADKLAADLSSERKEYDTGRVVYEGFRHYMHETDRWGWTASQVVRGQQKSNKILDLTDVADSIHKIRVADLVITLNLLNHLMTLFAAKVRRGKGRFKVGPYEQDFATGRLIKV